MDAALERDLAEDDWEPGGVTRPKRRLDCLPGGFNAERPCPFVSCKYHLYLEVKRRTGLISFTFPGLELDEIPETCALDVADRGGETLEVVGNCINVTRERIRQIEIKAHHRLEKDAQLKGLQCKP